MNLYVHPVSSLYKIREIADIPLDALGAQTLLRGEHFAFQLILYADTGVTTRISAEIRDKDGNAVHNAYDSLKLFRVQNVIMDYPMYDDADGDIITDKPGVMPDLLTPISDTNGIVRVGKEPVSVLFSLDTPANMLPGNYTLTVKLNYFDIWRPWQTGTATVSVELNVINELVPAQSVHFTQWFHVDSIAEAYNLPIYSEKHWELIDKFMAAARYLGIDTILTPILTPALDTMIGMERPKVQLVHIEKNGETYNFDFSLAERFIKLAKKNGIEHFEISHLYSQWGLAAAPNIYVFENGKEKKMFGWETDAQGKEYTAFLCQLLPALTSFLKQTGVYDDCFFHLSDEPGKDQLKSYTFAHNTVKPFIPDRPILDALSDIDFYNNGLTDIPVTATNHIRPFLDSDIPHQWAYYCCGQYKKTGNRFLTFPAYRNRILGIQLFKFNIKGFLQWGFNFYHSDHSAYYVNPYLSTSADLTFPSGDPFSVYPGIDGPLLTLRALVFKDALQDVEILKALERKTDHKYVVDLLEKYAGAEITFEDYPRNNTFITRAMDCIKRNLT